jgi:hypothetical protein
MRGRGLPSPDKGDAVIGASVLDRDQTNWAEYRLLNAEIKRRARLGAGRYGGMSPRTHIAW